MSGTTSEPLVTAKEIAALLSVSDRTVRRFAESGLLPSVRITERTIRFHREDVDALIAAGRRREA